MNTNKQFLKFALSFIVATIVNINAQINDIGPPYPIIFVHGINSNSDMWINSGIVNELTSVNYQWEYQEIDICLESNRNDLSGLDHYTDDVTIFSNVQKNDFYLINFDIDFSGNRKKIDAKLGLKEVIFGSDSIFEVEHPSRISSGCEVVQIGDILRIDDEYMKINSVESLSDTRSILSVERGLYGSQMQIHGLSNYLLYGFINTSTGLLGSVISNIGYTFSGIPLAVIFNQSLQSDQSSITKQAWGLSLAIEMIKDINETEKVILIGHSMGGLASRTYAQRFDSSNSVAKIITLGTPHLGFVLKDAILDRLDELTDGYISGVDFKSEAVRDMLYNYENILANPSVPGEYDADDVGVFLYGGNEVDVPENIFINRDINSNGIIGDEIIGLNSLNNIPSGFEYSFVIGDGKTLGDYKNDGIVLLNRQFLNLESNYFTEIFQIDAWHVKSFTALPYGADFSEAEKIPTLFQAMDESDIRSLSYEIKNQKSIHGNITPNSHNNPYDKDVYFFDSDVNGEYEVGISGIQNIHFWQLIIADENTNLFEANSYDHSSGSLVTTVDVLAGKRYYIEFSGFNQDGLELIPYTLTVNATEINRLNLVDIEVEKTICQPNDLNTVVLKVENFITHEYMSGCNVSALINNAQYYFTESGGTYSLIFNAPSIEGLYSIELNAQKTGFESADDMRGFSVSSTNPSSFQISTVSLNKNSYLPGRTAKIEVVLSENLSGANVVTYVPSIPPFTLSVDEFGIFRKNFYVPDIPGNYTIFIVAEADGFSPVYKMKQLVVDDSICVPIPIYPLQNSDKTSLTPTFEWEACATADGYDLKVYTYFNGMMTDIYFKSNLTTLAHTIPENIFTYDDTYRWTVRTRQEGLYSEWAPSQRFTTINFLDRPQLITPADSTENTDLILRFEWEVMPDATEYEIVLSKYEDFSSTFYDADVQDSYWIIPPDKLQESTTYYWYVQAKSPLGNSDESDIFMFQTGGSIPPGKPTLLLPINDAVNISTATTLSWAKGSGVSHSYSLQVSNDSTFTNIIYENPQVTNTSFILPPNVLQPNTNYWFRVAGNNYSGIGLYSEYNHFKTTNEIPSYGQKKWVKSGGFQGTPVFDNEGNFYLTGGNNLYKFNLNNGEILWQRDNYGLEEFDQGVTISLNGSNIYAIGDGEGTPNNESDYLVCFDTEGNIIWYRDTGGFSVLKPVVDSDGNIYVAMNKFNDDENISAVKSYDSQGSFRWEWIRDQGDEILNTPVISNGYIYISRKIQPGSTFGIIEALSLENGNRGYLGYSDEFDQMTSQSPAVSQNLYCYGGQKQINGTYNFYVLNSNNLRNYNGNIWPFKHPGDYFRTTPLIDNRGYIYTGQDYNEDSLKGYAYIFNSNSGQKLWEKSLPSDFGFSSVLGDDGIWYFNDHTNKNIYAVDINNMEELWAANSEITIQYMNMAPNGDLILVGADGIVSISTTSTGLLDAEWPSKYHDYQGTSCHNSDLLLYPPNGCNATKGEFSNKILISWNSNIPYDSLVIFKSMYRDSSFMPIATVTETQYSDSDLEVGQKFFYKVQCFYLGKSSVLDNTEPILGYTEWNEPNNLVGSKGTYENKVILSWSPPQKLPIAYDVYYSNSEGGDYSLLFEDYADTLILIYSIDTDKYWFKVKAKFNDYESDFSKTVMGWKKEKFQKFLSFSELGILYPIFIQNAFIGGMTLSQGDEIGAFYNDGENDILIGAVVFDSSKNILQLNSYLRSVIAGDTLLGAETGSEIILKVWDANKDSVYECYSYFEEGGYFGNGNYSNIRTTGARSSIVKLKLFLEGPFENNYMNSNLFEEGVIPLISSSAYDEALFEYESKKLDSLSTKFVDWVLIEIRENTNIESRISCRPGLLLENGQLIDVNGSDGVVFEDLIPGMYFIIVHHRNHLSIMSSQKIAITSNSIVYDFTTSQNSTFGNNSLKELGNGVFGMIGGDSNGDGNIDYNNDILSDWLPNFGLDGYLGEDINLNSIVDYNDDILVHWLQNFGLSSEVPGIVTKNKIKILSK